MKKNFLITFIIGTRPEAIKLASVIKAFNNSEIFNSRIILTGQHKEMVNEILEIWKIKPVNEINLEEIKKVFYSLRNDLIWLSLSGGEVTLVKYYYDPIK